MSATKDLVEDWIMIRTTLVRQVGILKSGQIPAGTEVADVSTARTIARVEACLREMNALLKEYARVQDR